MKEGRKEGRKKDRRNEYMKVGRNIRKDFAHNRFDVNIGLAVNRSHISNALVTFQQIVGYHEKEE